MTGLGLKYNHTQLFKLRGMLQNVLQSAESEHDILEKFAIGAHRGHIESAKDHIETVLYPDYRLFLRRGLFDLKYVL